MFLRKKALQLIKRKLLWPGTFLLNVGDQVSATSSTSSSSLLFFSSVCLVAIPQRRKDLFKCCIMHRQNKIDWRTVYPELYQPANIVNKLAV